MLWVSKNSCFKDQCHLDCWDSMERGGEQYQFQKAVNSAGVMMCGSRLFTGSQSTLGAIQLKPSHGAIVWGTLWDIFMCISLEVFPSMLGLSPVPLTAERNFDFYNKNWLGRFVRVTMNSCMCISRRLLQLHCKCKCLPDISCTFSEVERQKYSPDDSVLFLAYGYTFFFGYVKESL